MTDTTEIAIAEHFSRTPAGRYVTDGPFSGEYFRDKFLLPPLKAGRTVHVNLDGTLGYGSSFLEEAFGGLVRNGITTADLRKRLFVKSSREFYKNRIWRYIVDAEAQQKAR